MADFRELYRNELNDENTRYFILDTYSDGINDIDFLRYSWKSDKYNLVRENDLFIYRKPLRASTIGSFYLYGSGKISNILQNGNEMTGNITTGLLFGKLLTQTDLEDFNWTFKRRGHNWGYFFNQYGMTQIEKEDFINILTLQEHLSISEIVEIENNRDLEFTSMENELYQQQQTQSYHVPDQTGHSKLRGAAQAVFARAVKSNYRYKCCVTGISNADFLIASHIIPWSVDMNNRINPKNGLCLSVLLDKAFDKGYITFNDEYRLVVSSQIGEDELGQYIRRFENYRIDTYGGELPRSDFIQWHRENIFKG